MSDIKAVITGDLIGSRAMGPAAVDRCMALLADTAQRLSQQSGSQSRFTRNRGDGWQIYLATPGLCLSAALQISAALRADAAGLKTRQSIGLGPVSALPADDLAAAHGAAFEASGQGLDQMDKGRRMAINGPGVVTPWHQAIVALADWHSARWSREQAQAMALWLSDPDKPQADWAAGLGITRQALQARLSGAGYTAWAEALIAFQTAPWQKVPYA